MLHLKIFFVLTDFPTWSFFFFFSCPYHSVSTLAAGQVLERLDKHSKCHFLGFLQFFVLLSLAQSKVFKTEPHFKCFKKDLSSQKVLCRLLYRESWRLSLLKAAGTSVAAWGEILLLAHTLLPCIWNCINRLHQETLS